MQLKHDVRRYYCRIGGYVDMLFGVNSTRQGQGIAMKIQYGLRDKLTEFEVEGSCDTQSSLLNGISSVEGHYHKDTVEY